jgi:hypothetical protein
LSAVVQITKAEARSSKEGPRAPKVALTRRRLLRRRKVGVQCPRRSPGAARLRCVPGTFAAGLQNALQSVVAGSGPSVVSNNTVLYGDNPDNPRDPDRAEALNPAHLNSAIVSSQRAD